MIVFGLLNEVEIVERRENLVDFRSNKTKIPLFLPILLRKEKGRVGKQIILLVPMFYAGQESVYNSDCPK